MIWAKYFTNKILQRGKSYWEDGMVEDLERVDQDTYTATVYGTHCYYDSVRRLPKDRLRLGCNCPYARDGNTCKHMAAVLFEIEENDPEFFDGNHDEQPKKTPAAIPMVNPARNIVRTVPSDLFRNYPSDQFFRLECVYDTYTISNEVYTKALNIVGAGAINIKNCVLSYQSSYQTTPNDPPRIEMTCEMTVNQTDFAVKLALDKDSIYSLTCTQTDYYSLSSYRRRRSADNYEGCKKSNLFNRILYYDYGSRVSGKKALLCEHKCAALILFDRYLRENNPGDYTSYFGNALVSIIRRNEEEELAKVPAPSTSAPQQKEPPVDFLLRISADSSTTSDLTITASIGRTKYYKVRNISTLMANIRNGENVRFGKELSVDFSNTEFTERSKPLVDFILSLPETYIAGNIILMGYSQLDMFYLKFQETGIDHETLGHLSFCDKELRLNCSVEALEMNGSTEGLNVKIDAPAIFWGRNHIFTVDEKGKRFCRHSADSLGPLSEMLRLSGKHSFTATIGRKEMKDFNYRVLPILEKYGNVDTSKMPQMDEVSAILQPEFTFNLDYENKTVLCKSIVNYGDKGYNLCDETSVAPETRDTIRENAVRRRLDSYFGLRTDEAWTTFEDDDVYYLLSEGLNQLMEIGTVNATASFSSLKLQRKLRQVCCDPRLAHDNYDGESAKRTLCMDLVETAIDSGHRMLIFSQFTSMLSLLESDLKERNIPYYEIAGATDKRKRLQLVEDFNSSDIPVFLISLKAGGTGLNLTCADMVIHYDPWWNTAVQNQATDRVHRIGQTNVVTVYKLIASDSIEERILELQNSKKDLADEIIGGETTSLGKLSRENLLAILS